MRSGELRHLITIQQPSFAQDSSGSSAETWSTRCSIWAKIRPLRGREYYAANQAQMEITHEITIRYRSDVNAIHRVSYGNRIFRINAVMDIDENRRELVLQCVEVS